MNGVPSHIGLLSRPLSRNADFCVFGAQYVSPGTGLDPRHPIFKGGSSLYLLGQHIVSTW